MLAAIDVSDMHCSNCAARIETALRAVPGVDALFVNPARRQVLVEHAPDIDPSLFLTALRAIGFHPSLPSTGDHSKPQRESLMRIGIAGVAMLQTMIGMLLLHSGAMNGIEGADAQLLAYVSLAFTIPVVTYAAVPFYLSAWRSVSKRPRLPGMDVPVALAEVPMAFNQDMKAIIPGERISSAFLLYALGAFKRNLFEKVGRSAHGTMTLMSTEISSFAIPLPDRKTQDEIATAIETVETKLSHHRRKHATLSALFRTLLHQLMTAQLRVHDLELDGILEQAVQETDAP